MIARREFLGEFLGTFIIVLFGCGSVSAAVLFDAHPGLLQVGIVWGLGVALAIYATRNLSCAHLNPAVTIAMAVSGRMKPKKIPGYLLAQFFGAFMAALILFFLFNPSIMAFETAHGIVRGSSASVQTAKIFGEYYQSPGSTAVVSLPLAMAAEGLGTFLLVLLIFSLTEGCNTGRPDSSLTPLFIGLSVTSIICLLAPLTQAGLNPARDFAPRMVAYLGGWGAVAFPDQSGGFFFVYMLAPVLGGLLGAILFSKLIAPLMEEKKQLCCGKKEE